MTRKDCIERLERQEEQDRILSQQYSSLHLSGYYQGRADGYKEAIKMLKGGSDEKRNKSL